MADPKKDAKADSKATPAATEKKDAKPKVKVERFIERLTGGQGDQLRFIAQTRDGKTTSFVTHIARKADGSKEVKRGASAVHESLESATAVLKAAIEKAVAGGWIAKVKGARKSDAFSLDTLPAPAAAPAPEATK